MLVLFYMAEVHRWMRNELSSCQDEISKVDLNVVGESWTSFHQEIDLIGNRIMGLLGERKRFNSSTAIINELEFISKIYVLSCAVLTNNGCL